MAFEPVPAASDLRDGDMIGVVVRGVRVLLVRLEGEFYAYENRCAHLGLPLHDGRLSGSVLTCRVHEYQYDATTGGGINPRVACLKRYAVRADADGVAVDVAGGAR